MIDVAVQCRELNTWWCNTGRIGQLAQSLTHRNFPLSLMIVVLLAHSGVRSEWHLGFSIFHYYIAFPRCCLAEWLVMNIPFQNAGKPLCSLETLNLRKISGSLWQILFKDKKSLWIIPLSSWRFIFPFSSGDLFRQVCAIPSISKQMDLPYIYMYIHALTSN